MTIQQQQAEILREMAKSKRVMTLSHEGTPQWHEAEADALDAGAAALSRQREQDDDARSDQPQQSISSPDPRGDDRDIASVIEKAAKALLPFSWVGDWLFASDADDNELLARILTINNAPDHSLTRGDFKAASNARHALLAVQQSAALSQPSRQLEIEQAKDRMITQAFVAGQMDAQLKHADDLTRPSLALLKERTYKLALDSADALIHAVQSAALVPQGWQPIEALRKDQIYDLWVPMAEMEAHAGRLPNCSYSEPLASWVYRWGPEYHHFSKVNPSHGMPLPAPPLSPDPPQEK